MRNNHDTQSTGRLTRSVMLLAALTTGAWSVTSVAGDHDDHDAKAANEELFQRSDIDRDGRLSRDEFDKMRMNESGSASQQSSGQGLPATAHQSQAVRGFDDRDPDRDGASRANESHEVQTSDPNDSARSGMSQPSESSSLSVPGPGGSSISIPSGQSGFSGSTPSVQ